MTTIFLGLGSFDNNYGDSNDEVKKVLYTSLASLHDYDMKFLMVRQYGESKHTTMNFDSVPTIHFTYTWCFKRIEMIATDSEKTQRLFLIPTFSLPSPSSLLKLPILYYVALITWRDTWIRFLVSINCKL